MVNAEGFRAELEQLGEGVVRDKVEQRLWVGGRHELAVAWLEGKERARAFSVHVAAVRSDASKTALQRRAAAAAERAATAAETAAAAALASASEAKTSNEIARAANELAASANAFASRANNRARDANRIAITAMIVAALAAVGSMLTTFLRAH